MITINAQSTDIHATDAYRNTRFSPEQREQQIVDSYLKKMETVADEFAQWATAENAAEITTDLEEYRAGCARRLNAYLASHSRIASQMITGPAGWTPRMVERNNRRIDICDRRYQELQEYSRKGWDRLRSKYNPTARANAPIMAGDHEC